MLSTRALSRPSAAHPCLVGARTDVVDSEPFHENLGFASDRNLSVVPSISILFRACSPAAIVLAVAFLVVDAVKTHSSNGTRPHVRVEGLEGVPLGTDGNTSPTVVVEVSSSWIIASHFHPDPRAIFGTPIHAVPCVCRFGLINGEAPTASRMTTAQMASRYNPNGSANAAASPIGIALAGVAVLNNRETTERLSGEGAMCFHRRTLPDTWTAVKGRSVN